MKTFSQLTLLFAAAILTACSGGNKPNVELIQDMMESPAIKAQEYDEASPNHAGMRAPPEHTVPVGFAPYKYGMDAELAGKDNKNPIAGDYSQDTLLTGQKFFETNCMLCHGQRGEGGESTSIAKMMALKPPTLHSDKVKTWSDGRLYHVITMGQGVMGGYASHIPQKYRWQVVNYIRHLQKQGLN